MQRILLLITLVAASLAMPARATAADVAPCDPATPAALKFVDLPGKLVIGHEQDFGVDETHATGTDVRGPVELRMVNDRGRIFSHASPYDPGDALFYLTLELGTRWARVTAKFTEVFSDGRACQRALTKTVRAVTRIYFPSRCLNPGYKPRSIIVACGDGNFFLTGLRWLGWNRRVTRSRGTAHANDCIPYCAAGHFHPYPVKVVLSRRKLCHNVDRYVYTRLDYRYLRRPRGWRANGWAPFPCSIYDEP
jgi:hypothetical protein